MTMRSFTIADLCLSPLNVRTNQEDANATEALEASIAEHGLLFPLIVHPIKTGRNVEKGQPGWGVLAGGRRFRAISNLIAPRRLPRLFAIEVIIRDIDPSAITELSLAENLLRRDLRDYEINAAIAKAHQQGASPEQIASHFGQRLSWVRHHLRLGTLAPEIFAAYAAGKLSLDQARAYGATADTELQSAAFAQLAERNTYQQDARSIRAFLKVGDAELARMILFIGESNYRIAGGRFELDLFADEAETRGRVTDEGLLRSMVEAELTMQRNAIRIAAQDVDLRFAAAPPHFGNYIDHALEFHPSDCGEGDDRRITLPEGDVVATLDLADGGAARLRWWWASRKAKADAKKNNDVDQVASGDATPAQDRSSAGFNDLVSPGSAQAARAAARDTYGLTAEGVQIIRSLRRELLRALLVDDATFQGTLGRDYLVWSQLRQALAQDLSAVTGTRGLVSEYLGVADYVSANTMEPHFEAMKAHQIWTAALDHISAQAFMTIKDAGEAFAAFYAAGPQVKNTAGAVLAGLALLRSCAAGGWAIAAHDALAELAGADDAALRELWQPGPEFVALFPKLQRLAMVQPFATSTLFTRMQNLVSSELTAQSAEILRGLVGTNSDGVPVASDHWVHPLLSFGVVTDEARPIREAAE